MNALETFTLDTPYGGQDICPKFTVEDVLIPFTFHNITTVNREYSFSMWVRSDTNGSLLINGNNIPSSTEWTKHGFTFTAKKDSIDVYFGTAGVYYIYHPQLENGNKPTDWTKAPEDVDETIQSAQDAANDANETASNNSSRLDTAESLIQQLKDKISMLVTDADGTTLWEQTSDGFTFSMAETKETVDSMRDILDNLQKELGSVNATVETLNTSLSGIEDDLDWVTVTTYTDKTTGNDEPCLALGETGSDFKLLITNQRIMFMDGDESPAYISNKALYIEKAVLKDEFQQGGFVWKVRSNGSMGLIWRGVTS